MSASPALRIEAAKLAIVRNVTGPGWSPQKVPGREALKFARGLEGRMAQAKLPNRSLACGDRRANYCASNPQASIVSQPLACAGRRRAIKRRPRDRRRPQLTRRRQANAMRPKGRVAFAVLSLFFIFGMRPIPGLSLVGCSHFEAAHFLGSLPSLVGSFRLRRGQRRLLGQGHVQEKGPR